MGHGFAVAKLSSGGWSAPCFVTMKKIGIGALFGVEKSRTLMSSMTRMGIQQLVDNKYTEFGSDITVQLWPTGSHGPNDEVSICASDWVSASSSTGVIFDFSLSGGSMKIDDEKNHDLYGPEVSGSDILTGKMEKPQEMIPLYHKITEISKKALN